jgi:hypothetical protein
MQISEEITIKVSPNVAQAYQKATERKKQSLVTAIASYKLLSLLYYYRIFNTIPTKPTDKRLAKIKPYLQ